MDATKLRFFQYSTWVDLWKHHNDTQLKWPQFVVSASVLMLPVLLHNNYAFLTQTPLRHLLAGNPQELGLTFGIPLLLASLCNISMVYIMVRAQHNMVELEYALTLAEHDLGLPVGQFHILNHQKGVSGPRLLRIFMHCFLIWPIFLTSLSSIMGIWYGILCVGVGMSLWFFLNQSRYRHEQRTQKRLQQLIRQHTESTLLSHLLTS